MFTHIWHSVPLEAPSVKEYTEKELLIIQNGGTVKGARLLLFDAISEPRSPIVDFFDFTCDRVVLPPFVLEEIKQFTHKYNLNVSFDFLVKTVVSINYRTVIEQFPVFDNNMKRMRSILKNVLKNQERIKAIHYQYKHAGLVLERGRKPERRLNKIGFYYSDGSKVQFDDVISIGTIINNLTDGFLTDGIDLISRYRKFKHDMVNILLKYFSPHFSKNNYKPAKQFTFIGELLEISGFIFPNEPQKVVQNWKKRN